ncbi:hypothetical protein IWX50DRAFT_153763 [Phyllosticta citricarpa]
MDDLDDLVVIEDEDFVPSSPLLSRTASPTMCNVDHASLVTEKGISDEGCIHSPQMDPSSVPHPPVVEVFSPPPPPPSSESLASTRTNDEPVTSSLGLPADEPPPFTALAKEATEDDDISNDDSVAGLQAAPKPKLDPLSKPCNYPVTLHNGKVNNHTRRRRCGFNDQQSMPRLPLPLPPLPPPPPPGFWYTQEDDAGEPVASEAPSPGTSVPEVFPPLPPIISPTSGQERVPHTKGRNRKKGLKPLGPPPPLPPHFDCAPPFPIPPPPVPPPTGRLLQPVAFSAHDLVSARYWHQVPIERTLELDRPNTTLESRTGILLHHRASPFDLHHWLWLLKYGEPERWYARPAEAELARLRRFEAKGLSSDVADLIANEDSEERQPATRARVVKLWVGEVMGFSPSPSPPPPFPCSYPLCSSDFDIDAQRRLENEFLVFYSVVEAPERLDDDELGDSDGDDEDDEHRTRSTRRACDEALAGGEKVYKVERTGSVDACLARAWHNAIFNGWSTVFSCVVAGHVDMVQADNGMGVNGFERVDRLDQLVGGSQGASGKTRIFY